MVSKQQFKSFIGKFAYSILFIFILPLILICWAYALDKSINWPVPNWQIIGIISLLLGSLMILKGMRDLYVYGKGLPMNPYPPEILVTNGIFAWFSHPIYLGTAMLSFGVSLWLKSSSGLYIVTPTLILMMFSLVYGYERSSMKRLFGDSMENYNPIFSLPSSGERHADWIKKIAMFILIFLPWFISGYLIDYARCAGNCGNFVRLLNTQNWQAPVWIIPYIYILVRLFAARTEGKLLHATIMGIVAAFLGIFLYLVLPAFGLDLSDLVWLSVSVIVVLTAACYRFIWSKLLRFSEWVANSRHDWVFLGGRFRIINHSIYSGLGGVIGVGILSYVLGNNFAAMMLGICILIGAALLAQLWWGSASLLRPFGYWGAVLGFIIGTILIQLIFHISFTQIALAGVLCAPFAQAVGRLRCLAQGCCHGIPTKETLGIRVWQEQSRVVVLSGLKGKYILATQLYSIIFNVILGFLLWSLWLSHSISAPLIIGLYLILTGIERFAEDEYRGEKQTKTAGALKQNQWIAIIALIIGIIITTIQGSPQSDTVGDTNLSLFATALGGGFMAAFFMSIDFPKSHIKFSRLSG